MKSIRTYQRELKALRELIEEIQWVQPSYNGDRSCSGCGEMIYHGCSKDCPVAKVTGHRGHPESEEVEGL